MFSFLANEKMVHADVPPQDSKWIPLISSEGLSGWRPVNNDQEHEWQSAELVTVNPNYNQRLSIHPGNGMLTNAKFHGKTQNLLSVETFSDIEAHIEFFHPNGSNSGIFFMAIYELQVNDTYGKQECAFSDCGGFYARRIGDQWVGGTGPQVNACKPPGEWQSFDVVFRSPSFDSKGNKTENARFIQVMHNNILIHENVEMEGPNSAHLDIPESPQGPLMLQGDHGPVAYRNIRVRRFSGE